MFTFKKKACQKIIGIILNRKLTDLLDSYLHTDYVLIKKGREYYITVLIIIP